MYLIKCNDKKSPPPLQMESVGQGTYKKPYLACNQHRHVLPTSDPFIMLCTEWSLERGSYCWHWRVSGLRYCRFLYIYSQCLKCDLLEQWQTTNKGKTFGKKTNVLRLNNEHINIWEIDTPLLQLFTFTSGNACTCTRVKAWLCLAGPSWLWSLEEEKNWPINKIKELNPHTIKSNL